MDATDWMFVAAATLLVFGIVMVFAICGARESSRECSRIWRLYWDSSRELDEKTRLAEGLQARLDAIREALDEEAS